MIQSKNIFLKVVGYFIIGGFSLLIVISFGLPEQIMQRSAGKNTYATVNGRSITHFDYVRYVNSSPYFSKNSELANQYKFYIINQLINRELLAQLAENLGISVDAKIVKKMIQRSFTDPSGNFQKDAFAATLKGLAMSPAEYYEMAEKDILRREIQMAAKSASGLARSELAFRKKSMDSKFVIKYAILDNEQIKAQYADRLVVTDEELNKLYDDALAQNKVAAETEKKVLPLKKAEPLAGIDAPKIDPVEEKKAIRTRVENQKLSLLKQELANKVSELSKNGARFEDGAAVVPGSALLTKPFAPGEAVYSDQEQPMQIGGLENEDSFLEDLLHLPAGSLGRGISTPAGVCIFTVVSKEIPQTPEVDASFAQDQSNRKIDRLIKVMLDPFSERSNIRRYEIE